MPAQHVLVINPNTSDCVTQRLVLQLGEHWPGVQVHGVTADFGAPYIADEYSYCVAGHAVLDAWERAQSTAPKGGYACVLIGCFGDPGLDALREVAPIPVWGLAQASMLGLAAQGLHRIAIVTGGSKWKPMLERWSAMQGYGQAVAPTVTTAIAPRSQVVHIAVLPATRMEMLQSPERAANALAHASVQALQAHGAQAVLLGGAGLAGMGAKVRSQTGLEVWDCVEAAKHWLSCSLQRPLAAASAVTA